MENRTDENFSDAIRKILDERKITYEELASLSGVSKTYLASILVHRKIPSQKIISDIAKALKKTSAYFKESRILAIIDDIKFLSEFITLEELQNLQGLVQSIMTNQGITSFEAYDLFSKNKKTSFENENVINISDLHDHQTKILKYAIKQFRIENNQKK